MTNGNMFYYRIYDDKEQVNYIRTVVEQKKIRQLLQDFEKVHQEYYNSEFIHFLKEKDPQAELIEVMTITY
ncbi:MAG: hypothetical protein EPO24_16140 [Bacteroidetes bacterium]|nr:MAG: hypothetical protein EPO24_16140 [Bacteroidota bacterium]